MGVYSSFGNVSNVVSPLILGGIAQIWGLEATFKVTAIAALMGVFAIIIISRRGAESESMSPKP